MALAAERDNWQLYASDSVAAAVALADKNANQNGLSGRLQTTVSHWFEQWQGQLFDLIVSNPPYIAAHDAHLECGDLRFEPATALVSGSDGLDAIRLIVASSPAFLHDSGWLMLEHGYDQGAAVRSLYEQQGLQEVKTVRDLAALERVTIGRKGPSVP